MRWVLALALLALYAAPAHAAPVAHVAIDPPTRINEELLTGTAGIAVGDTRAVSVRFFRPGHGTVEEPESAIALGIADDGSFSTAVPFLADGDWTVQAVQTDAADHATFSTPVTFSFDRTGPTVEITSPGPSTNDPRVSIAGTAGSEARDLANVSVTVTGPDVDVTVAAAIDRDSFHAELPVALADGHYTAVARQLDELGHVGTSTQAFEVDTVAPALSLSGPEGDVTAAQVSGTAGEAGIVQLELRGSGGFVAAASARVVDGVFASTFNVPDGSYTARAVLIDAAGNAGVAIRAFRLVTPAPAIAAETRPPDTRAVTPASVRKAAAALKITKATRHGRTVTVKGTAAKAATGTVTVSAGGVKKRVKLTRGKWSATLRTNGRKVTVAYSGDAAHLPMSTSRAVR